MPELNSAPADASPLGTDRFLNTDFEYSTRQELADWNESKSTNIASATTTDIGAATAPFVHVTGTTTITGLGTVQAGTRRIVVFDGILTLTHNASSLILPTAANITTAAGDVAVFVSEGSGNWRCVGYTRADGTSLAGSPSSVDSVNGQTGVVVLTQGDIAATINDETASYTAVMTDEVVVMDNASANNFTVPPNSSVAFPVGCFLEVWQKGAGQTTIVAGSGVTILYHADNTLKLKGQNSGCSLRKVATDTWRLIGDMEQV